MAMGRHGTTRTTPSTTSAHVRGQCGYLRYATVRLYPAIAGLLVRVQSGEQLYLHLVYSWRLLWLSLCAKVRAISSTGRPPSAERPPRPARVPRVSRCPGSG